MNKNSKIVVSCSQDDAVARLMGWLGGPLDPEPFPIDKCIETPAYLKLLSSLGAPIEQRLQEFDLRAKQLVLDWKDKLNNEEDIAEVSSYYQMVNGWKRQAENYRKAVEGELAKKKKSLLDIDANGTDSFGRPYITIDSLEDWAMKKFKISLQAPLSVQSDSEHYLDSETDGIEGNYTSGGRMSATKANNFLTTFAFMIDAIAAMSSKYGKDKPNVDAIAKHLEKLAAEASRTDQMKGQSAETIKNRIEEAVRVRDSNLPER